jgi:hypothetical protein
MAQPSSTIARPCAEHKRRFTKYRRTGRNGEVNKDTLQRKDGTTSLVLPERLAIDSPTVPGVADAAAMPPGIEGSNIALPPTSVSPIEGMVARMAPGIGGPNIGLPVPAASSIKMEAAMEPLQRQKISTLEWPIQKGKVLRIGEDLQGQRIPTPDWPIQPTWKPKAVWIGSFSFIFCMLAIVGVKLLDHRQIIRLEWIETKDQRLMPAIRPPEAARATLPPELSPGVPPLDAGQTPALPVALPPSPTQWSGHPNRLRLSRHLVREQTAGDPVVSSPEPTPGASPLRAEQAAALLKLGEDLLKQGDIATARVLLKRAAIAGDAQAALTVGMTFDQAFLTRWGVLGPIPDAAQAREWYDRAIKLGSTEASRHLERLANLLK